MWQKIGVFFLAGCLCATAGYAEEPVKESLYSACLKQLPKTLHLSAGAPETMRLFVPKENYWQDYETVIAGKGWGASLKYHNVLCDVFVYAYDKQKELLEESDAKLESETFDGFKPARVFEKEVGDFKFFGSATIAPLDTTDKQVQMASVSAVHHTFIKYRTVCRHFTDLPDESNYRIADVMTSQVMKETLIPLDKCLTSRKTIKPAE